MIPIITRPLLITACPEFRLIAKDEMETWLLTVKQKKEAYDTMIIPIGGKTEDKDDTEGGHASIRQPELWHDSASHDTQAAERTVTWSPSPTTAFR